MFEISGSYECVDESYGWKLRPTGHQQTPASHEVSLCISTGNVPTRVNYCIN